MLANRTIVRLEEMLDDAIEGTFVEDKYDESRMSRLESRWKDFLSNSVLSNKNLETERQRLEQFISDIRKVFIYTCHCRTHCKRKECACVRDLQSCGW